ncbi:DUF397 domain-containing protein [Actinoallomurus purpureus]|nr:DUF397 domain-containing protein [Actinoallomurus purpureus]MCO6003380.1 DUF397 domain-containing protein [Actinoallomurus purpureus]
MHWRKNSRSGAVNDEACVEVTPVIWQEVAGLMAQVTTDDTGR